MSGRFSSITEATDAKSLEEAALVSLNSIGDGTVPDPALVKDWYKTTQQRRDELGFQSSSTVFLLGIQVWCSRSSDHGKAFETASSGR